jgi:hypothetical protein
MFATLFLLYIYPFFILLSYGFMPCQAIEGEFSIALRTIEKGIAEISMRSCVVQKMQPICDLRLHCFSTDDLGRPLFNGPALCSVEQTAFRFDSVSSIALTSV